MSAVIGTGLRAMALGRLALGAAALGAPDATSRAFGMSASAMTPELRYMARVFGIRAIALGAGYLASGGDARRLWQRLAFACDISDTIVGAGHVRRGDLPEGAAPKLTGMTALYAAFGAARIAEDATS